MLSDMGLNNLFDPVLDKLIEHGCLTRDRTQLSDPMLDKPIEPGLFNMALDRIVQFPCRTIVSNAMSDMPSGCIFFGGVWSASNVFQNLFYQF
jgi:hypothetical protein